LSNPKDEKVVELHAILSVIKPISTWNVQERIQPLREIMGGHGYSRFNMIGNWRDNNDINLTWEGDNTVLNQQTARFITNALKKKVKGKEVKFTTLSFLGKFEEVLNEKINIADAKELRNPEVILKILEHRTNLVLQKCVARLTEKIGNNMPVFDAWNESQVFFLQSLTRSFGELYVFNCYLAKIKQLVDNPTRKVLFDMMILFALTAIEKDMALLRENDFVQSEFGDLVRNEILVLCSTLKDELINILDVISEPDEILGAPLGASTGFVFENYLNSVYNFKGCFERADWWEILHHQK
jgi:acyl-CoA oxidase